MLDEAVGNTQAVHVRRGQAGVGRRFEDGATETTHERRLFHRHDERARLDGPQNRFGIERFDEPGVDDADVEPGGCIIQTEFGTIDPGGDLPDEGVDVFGPLAGLSPEQRAQVLWEAGYVLHVRGDFTRLRTIVRPQRDVIDRLARGEPVAAAEYFFRTLMRFGTGAPQWLHLNKVMALAVGQRQANAVLLDVYRIT